MRQLFNNQDEVQILPKLQLAIEHNIQVIKISGKFIYGTTKYAKDTIKESFDDSVNGYLFDMSEIEYIDSTGFGVLINFAKTIAELERKMAILVTDSFIFDLFKISKLDLVFPVVKSKEDGYKILNDGYKSVLPLENY